MAECKECRATTPFDRTGSNTRDDNKGLVIELCPTCRADLELGRLVRAMPTKFALVHNTAGEWVASKYGTVNDEEPDEWWGDTPEAALNAAKL